MKENISEDQEMEKKSLGACRVLIGVYASTLTKCVKENGDSSFGAITDDVKALANLILEVNRARRF